MAEPGRQSEHHDGVSDFHLRNIQYAPSEVLLQVQHCYTNRH
jgi:hypothetical protein